MDLKPIDLGRLQERFATFITLLHASLGMSLIEISQLIVRHPNFDCLERNEAEGLLEEGYEAIASEVFARPVAFDYDPTLPAEVYWAAYQLIHVAIFSGTPLKRVALLCPLDALVAEFSHYHEMDDDAMVARYCEHYAKISVLRLLLGPWNVTKLAALSGIKVPTLHRYFDNDALYSATFRNIDLLSDALDAPISLFRERSFFLPYDPVFFRIDEFRDGLIHGLLDVLSLRGIGPEDIEIVTTGVEPNKAVLVYPPYQEPSYKEIVKILDDHKAVLVTSHGLTQYKKASAAVKSEVLDRPYALLLRALLP